MAAFVVAKMESKVGKSIGSQSLIANSREAMLDVFTSLVVSIGILLAYFKIPYVEGAIIILIAILLFKLGIENIWTSLLILNEFLNEQRHIGVKVARVIVKYKIGLLLTSNIGEISFHVLKDNLVDIYKTKEGLSVNEIINSYRLNQLQPLTGPTHSVEESQVSR